MTLVPPDNEAEGQPTRQTRGRTKPFPLLKLDDALILAQTIYDQGVGNQMRRLSLFDRLNRSPESGLTRQLISTSARYGLTIGGPKAERISLGQHGAEIVGQPFDKVRGKVFDCAIRQF